jgi:hypothetical protein
VKYVLVEELNPPNFELYALKLVPRHYD